MTSTATLTPRKLNHYALPATDVAETHRFWTEVMGCRFQGALRMDSHPMTTGEMAPEYIHTFYAMSDGSCIAFFELAGGVDKEQGGAPSWTKHIALSVASRAELAEWQAHLLDKGVEFAGEIDHNGVFYSIYFFDPNGQRIELTYQPNPMSEEDRVAGLATIEDWSERKAAGTLG
jgi:catechol 2,3-dioxygenase-like lactoylglutathione lyase family enzyme